MKHNQNSKLSFRPLEENDLPLLNAWLNKPHMRDHYQKQPITLAEVKAKFLPRIHGQFPTRDHVVCCDGRPIGKLQCYRVADHPEFAEDINLHEGIGVDLFIGEADMLVQGIGRQMLHGYIEEVAFPCYPSESKCFICHELTNIPARRCSIAAGFIPLRQVLESGVACELLVYLRKDHAGVVYDSH